MKLSVGGSEDENIFFEDGPFTSDIFPEPENDDLLTQLYSDIGLADFIDEDITESSSIPSTNPVSQNDIYQQYFSSDPNPLFDDIIMSEDASSESSGDFKSDPFSPTSGCFSTGSTSNSFPPSPTGSDSSGFDQPSVHHVNPPQVFIPATPTTVTFSSIAPVKSYNGVQCITPVTTASILTMSNLGKMKVAIPKITKPVAVTNSAPLVLTLTSQYTHSGIIKVATTNSTVATTRVITPTQQMAPIVIKTEPLSPLSSGLPTVQTVSLSGQPRFAIQTITTSSSKDNDMKCLKRQQRMIKNRESACLSRRKKKEYVTNLEEQLAQASKENTALKRENEQLKRRLFELESEKKLLSGNGVLSNQNLKKGTALLAILFVMSINFGSMNLVNESSFGKRPLTMSSSANNGKFAPIKVGRTLLWAPTEAEMKANSSDKTMCPMYFNQSESIRLDNQLRGWFQLDPVSNPNSTLSVDKPQKPFRRPTKRKVSLSGQNLDNAIDPFVKAKLNIPNNVYHMRLSEENMRDSKPGKFGVSKQSSIAVYDTNMPRFDFESFFEAIHRREDTFYVVSFSGDHLLLPATSRNESARPRMSLFLPSVSVPVNESMKAPANHVSMMQIDCEVINTGLVHISENSIPIHLTSRRKPEPRPSPTPAASNSSLQRNESEGGSFENFRPKFDRQEPKDNSSTTKFGRENFVRRDENENREFVQEFDNSASTDFNRPSSNQKGLKHFGRKMKKSTEP